MQKQKENTRRRACALLLKEKSFQNIKNPRQNRGFCQKNFEKVFKIILQSNRMLRASACRFHRGISRIPDGATQASS